MGMCVQIVKRGILILAVLAFLGGCEAMDTILPSSGTYKVNARVGDFSLDDLSFVSTGAKIQPFFEENVSGDPDVTGLIVYLKDSKGDITGWKVIYTLNGYAYTEKETGENQPQKTQENVSIKDDEGLSKESESSDEDEAEEAAVPENTQKPAQFKHGEEYAVTVRNLDNLPIFPLPPDLRMGRYTLVSQVLSGNDIIDKTEKAFYYLAGAVFSFDSILIHQPGIAESPQLISKNTVIMLEAKINFDSGLDPYIVWYNGKRIIGQGNYSTGAGNLLWAAPEQSGFVSLRAEAFPVSNRQELSGYVKDISLLVSTKTSDMHLLSENAPNLMYRYIFDGNLNDSKNKSSVERALKPEGNISPKWIPAGGTYGLVTGINNAYTLPEISLSKNRADKWQILCRFKPLDNGDILIVQFRNSSNTAMILSADDDKLILTLASSQGSVSETITLPETDVFITAAINFSAFSDRLSADLNITGNFGDVTKLSANPIVLETETAGKFIIMLGGKINNSVSDNEKSDHTAARSRLSSALWDELAVITDAPFESDADERVDSNFVEELFKEEQPESGGDSGSVSAV
jgi:hypothetical protein